MTEPAATDLRIILARGVQPILFCAISRDETRPKLGIDRSRGCEAWCRRTNQKEDAMLPDKLFVPENTPLDMTPWGQPVRVVRGDAVEGVPKDTVAFLRADAAAAAMEAALEHQGRLHAAEKASWELAAATEKEHARREADAIGYARGLQEAGKDVAPVPAVRGAVVITG